MAYAEIEKIRDALYEADAITFRGLSILNNFPAANVEEVKHGYWIAKASTHISKKGRIIHYDRYKCSECGKWNGRHKPNYCPHCGADMRGEKNE